MNKLFKLAVLASFIIGIGTLLVLIIDVFQQGFGRVDWQFLTSFPSRNPAKAGILAALVGSLFMIAITSIIAIPLGVGAAIYLEEYAQKNRLTALIEIYIASLAGTPSIFMAYLVLNFLYEF
jgi:phosphate transport system permease protein